MGQNLGWCLLTPSFGSVLSLLSKEELLLPSVSPRSQPEPAEIPTTLLPAFPQGPLQPQSPPPCPPVIPPKPSRLLPEFGECYWATGLWVVWRAGSGQIPSLLVASSPLGVLGLHKEHALPLFSVSCLPSVSMADP